MAKTYTLWAVCENCLHRQKVEIPVGYHWVDARWFSYGGCGESGYKKGYPGRDGAFCKVVCKKCGLALLGRASEQETEVDEEQEPTIEPKSDLIREFTDLLFDLNIPYEDRLKIIEKAKKVAVYLLFYNPKGIIDEYKQERYITDNRTKGDER